MSKITIAFGYMAPPLLRQVKHLLKYNGQQPTKLFFGCLESDAHNLRRLHYRKLITDKELRLLERRLVKKIAHEILLLNKLPSAKKKS